MTIDEAANLMRAMADENRLRALLVLRDRELCVCHVIEVLGLAPSTVSKHLSILHDAGLVERRKEGKWHHYRLAGRSAPPAVRAALRCVLSMVGDDATVAGDAASACCATEKDPQEATACYRR